MLTWHINLWLQLRMLTHDSEFWLRNSYKKSNTLRLVAVIFCRAFSLGFLLSQEVHWQFQRATFSPRTNHAQHSPEFQSEMFVKSAFFSQVELPTRIFALTQFFVWWCVYSLKLFTKLASNFNRDSRSFRRLIHLAFTGRVCLPTDDKPITLCQTN